MNTVESEKMLIGSVLQDPSILSDIRVTEDYFSVHDYRESFRVIRELEMAGNAIDVLSVSDRLSQSNSSHNWMLELSLAIDAAFSPALALSAQKIIEQEYRNKEIKKITYALNNDFEIDTAIQALMALDNFDQKYTYKISEAIQAGITRVREAEKAGGLVGLPTGIIRLDQSIAGFQDPDLYVIGARPAMGKTSLALNMMISNNCPAGFISTEQPIEQLGLRTISIYGGVSSRRLRSATLQESDWPRITETVKAFSDRPIFIHDKSVVSITEVMRLAQKMQYDHDIKILYVDYLQRITSPKAESKRMEVLQVAAGLKTIAKELKIPVVALAQVVREVDKRTDKRPRMGDLQESGAIEQEADTIMLLYRDEIYNPDTQDKGIMEILIDKNRHGPTGRVKAAWIGEQMKVGNLIQEAGNF